MNAPTTKTCRICGEEKPVEEFYLRTDSKTAGTRKNDCRACFKAQTDDARLRRKYGISTMERDRLLLQQSHRCAICGELFKSSRETHTDHDHASGKVRGLLCDNCNKGIGLLKDSAEIAFSAAEYLAKARN